MAWEQRGSNSYYYKKEREGSKVKSVYVGRGEMAHMISKLESSSAELERLMRARRSLEANELDRAEAPLDRAIELTQLFTQAALHCKNWGLNMIPEVSRDKILAAMGQFDSELRLTEDWRNWEQNSNFMYAINYEGRHYPVKQIVSMATGVPVNNFSGGDEANDWVRLSSSQKTRVRVSNAQTLHITRRNSFKTSENLRSALDH